VLHDQAAQRSAQSTSGAVDSLRRVVRIAQLQGMVVFCRMQIKLESEEQVKTAAVMATSSVDVDVAAEFGDNVTVRNSSCQNKVRTAARQAQEIGGQ
jgi:hypothetical protein